jgi:hypothetical protein
MSVFFREEEVEGQQQLPPMTLLVAVEVQGKLL